MEQSHFGEHLMIDGYGGDPERLSNKEIVLSCLQTLPELTGMHILGEPIVYEATGKSPKDSGGWSGFVVIEESHISVHTFPKRKFVSIDVYTCQSDINKEFIIKFFEEKFLFTDIETNFVIRGTRYPERDIE